MVEFAKRLLLSINSSNGLYYKVVTIWGFEPLKVDHTLM